MRNQSALCRIHIAGTGIVPREKFPSTESDNIERYRAGLFYPEKGGNVSLSTLTLRENCQCLLRTLTTAVFVLLPATLFAQGYFGTISGILTDPSTAVIQGATVTLLDEEKG
jgi:hypothetical protein